MTLTIIEAAAIKKLTTLDRVKAELGVSGAADDAYLGALINEVSTAVATWCRRCFARETVRQVFRLETARRSLALARWPNITINAISIGDTDFSPVEFEADDSGLLYRLDASGNRTDWCRGRVTVEYDAGYVLPGEEDRDLPQDIERAALMLIKADWYARDRDPLIRTDATEGIGSTAYQVGGFRTVSGFPPEVEGLLSGYRAVII